MATPRRRAAPHADPPDRRGRPAAPHPDCTL